MDLSIVTTLYYSAPYLEEFYARTKKETEKITNDYEMIFVNDDSPDNSLEVALSLQKRDNKIRVIDMAKNYVHQKTMVTGISFARGDLVFLIDCDLEEEPELLGEFYNELKRTNADSVYGQQVTRKGGIFEKVSGAIFYSVLNLLSDIPIPRNLITARLMTQRYVHSLVSQKEREIYLGGLFAIAGFKQIPVRVKKYCCSPTTYTLTRKVKDAVNGILSFSNKPLVFIFYSGIVIVSLTTPAIFYLIYKYFFMGISIIGWTSLMLSIWFLSGLIIFMLGVIGLYLSKIFIETKNRPYVVIRDIYEPEGKKEYKFTVEDRFIIT